MVARVPQTIGQQTIDSIMALGSIPASKRSSLDFARHTRDIRSQIAKLYEARSWEAALMEMQLEATLLNKTNTEKAYKKAKALGADANIEYNYAVALCYLGKPLQAAEHLINNSPPSEKKYISAAEYYLDAGRFIDSIGVLDEGLRLNSDLIRKKVEEITLLIQCNEDNGLKDNDFSRYFSLLNCFVRDEGVFFSDSEISASSDGQSTWISHYFYPAFDLDQVMALNEKWVDLLAASDIETKVQKHICTVFIYGGNE